MERMTVSQVSKNLGISARMLRYYEQEGLITSLCREGYSYRVYDDHTVLRIRQILLLRKLRIPVRQIKLILENTDTVAAIEIFRQNIRELDEEITALPTVRDILRGLLEELGKTTVISLESIMPSDEIGFHGYEAWVIVPEDLENLQFDLLMPVKKKRNLNDRSSDGGKTI